MRFSIDYRKGLKEKINFFLVLLLIFQVTSWYFTRKELPVLGILDEKVPSLNEAKAQAFGDEQFYFRYQAMNLQNSGDSFGRFTALKDYDYKVLLKWLKLLDDLDSRSNFLPAIASYYYSNTQRVEDNRYIVDYLEYTYDKRPADKWWWLGMAANIANFKLKDYDLSLRLAFKLSNTPGEIPRWAQQMPAIIYAQTGQNELALKIIEDLANRYDNYKQSDLNFMNYFVKERLGYLKKEIKPNYEVEQDVEPMYPKK